MTTTTTTTTTTTKMTTTEEYERLPWAWIKCIRDMVEDSGESLFTQSPPPALPVEILPWLYLSDERSVRDVSRLRKVLGITHVLTTNGMPAHQVDFHRSNLASAGIVHKNINGQDEEGYDMIGNHWEECRALLESVRDRHNELREEGGGNHAHPPRVVVHCAAGINRSGLIVCAAYMVLEKVNVVEVVRRVLALRGTVLWNRSFQRQLCQLAASEGLLGDKPDGYTDDVPNPSFLGGGTSPTPREALDRLL